MTLSDFLPLAAGADACGPDPILDPKIVDRWFFHGNMAGDICQGNDLLGLYPGKSVFDKIVLDIRFLADSDQSYIYLLGWWFTDSFPFTGRQQ